EIHEKYSIKIYNKYLMEMRKKDIYYETGNKTKVIKETIKYRLCKNIFPSALKAGILSIGIITASVPIMRTNIIKENAITYMDDIDEYNNNIQKYASEINKMELSDLEVIMKVMSDMWNSIKGYGTPEKDIGGYYRLDLMDENGYGVCRNMADDITAKLNAINPNYNARNLIVYLYDNEWTFSNIDRVFNNNEQEVISNTSDEGFDTTKIWGNHMVTAIDIKDENITLIIDPTNVSLGILKNGKIHMFSTKDGKGLKIKPIGMSLLGIKGVKDHASLIIDSYLSSNTSIEELKEKYGLDAQNNALKYLANLESDKIKSTNINELENSKETLSNIMGLYDRISDHININEQSKHKK
ncbi:MAG TPA: hypothetical protein GX747_02880, partial [Tenericutes bacterium]|nr:hypothetical protein [Mycoplasmatota bacterium]